MYMRKNTEKSQKYELIHYFTFHYTSKSSLLIVRMNHSITQGKILRYYVS